MRMLIITSAIVVAMFGATETAIADHGALLWHVTDSSGLFSVTSHGTCISPHGDLPSEVSIATLGRGRITLRRGSESVVVLPRTSLTIAALTGRRTRVIQTSGMAWFKIAKRDRPHFFVQTPNLTATVRGTTFTVAVDGLGASVHVREGTVEVATVGRDAVALVQAGTTARVGGHEPDGIALIAGANVTQVASGRPDGRALLRRDTDFSAAQAPRTVPVAAIHKQGERGAHRPTGSGRAVSVPILETVLAALALFMLIVVSSVFGQVRRASVRGQGPRRRRFDFGGGVD